jgi:hypothetical protein
MNKEIERMWKEALVAYSEVLFNYFLEEAEGKSQNT